MLQASPLSSVVQYTASDHILVLNSAADPFVSELLQQPRQGSLTLAEDSVASLATLPAPAGPLQTVAFHDYMPQHPPQTMDIALLNLLYQPSKSWMNYAVQVAFYALRADGRLYVVGSKDRGILSFAKYMHMQFSNVETLLITKGQRVLCARKPAQAVYVAFQPVTLPVFADSKLDDGTRLLLSALEVHETDRALDLGCGAGFLGLQIARMATRGHVTMVDASLAAVDASGQAVERSGLSNIHVLPSDGAQAVLGQRFDLVVTNPPFHLGGIQTTEVAQRFILQAAHVLQPQGRFYLVANRFLKYEPTLRLYFKNVVEVAGDARYKVLLATSPLAPKS